MQPFSKMVNELNNSIYLFIAVLFCGCANSYKSITPNTITYQNEQKNNGLAFSYQYNVLDLNNNSRNAKKELKQNIYLLAVKLVNDSQKSIFIDKDVLFKVKDSIIVPLEVNILHKKLKQNQWSHLLLGLIALPGVQTTCTKGQCSSRLLIPIPIGMPFGITNMIIASKANFKFKKELKKFNIINKEIKPGEQVYGLMGVYNPWFGPITIEKKLSN